MPFTNWTCRSIRKRVRQLARSRRLAGLPWRKPSEGTEIATREDRCEPALLSDNPNLKLDYEGIRFCDELKL